MSKSKLDILVLMFKVKNHMLKAEVILNELKGLDTVSVLQTTEGGKERCDLVSQSYMDKFNQVYWATFDGPIEGVYMELMDSLGMEFDVESDDLKRIHELVDTLANDEAISGNSLELYRRIVTIEFGHSLAEAKLLRQ